MYSERHGSATTAKAAGFTFSGMPALRHPPHRAASLPEGERTQAQWALSLITRLRLAHIVFELALLYPALRYGWMFASDVPWYLGVLGGLTAFNIITMMWRRRKYDVGSAFLSLQVAVDLTAMTVLFGVSGGLTNPVHTLVHFQVGLAGILLSPRAALAALALGLGALAVLAGSTQSIGNAYAWIGPLGPNLAYEWALAVAVSGLSIFAARLNRHYRDRLREAQERLRQQDRLRAAGAVASGFCHELASPLNAAGLLAARLQRKTAAAAPADLTEEWRELNDSLAQCDRIVRSMAGTPWEPEEFGLQTADPGLLIRKLAAGWRGRAPLRLDAGVAPGLVVRAPAVGLAQILSTLLRNAEEASRDGAPLAISMTLVREGGQDAVCVTVADRGTGIEPRVLGALGTPFNTSKGAGRGLGLFASLHLTESLGGSLTLSPREGGGTLARLILPRADVSARGLRDSSEAAGATA